jgi:hypothetical protein
MFDHYRPSDYFTIERADSGMTVARNSKGEVIASAVTTEQGEIVLK